MNFDNPNLRDCHCKRCDKEFEIKDLNIKMGGLLCPNCSLILINAGTEVFNYEKLRRNKNLKSWKTLAEESKIQRKANLTSEQIEKLNKTFGEKED